jgi:hypothetical protein
MAKPSLTAHGRFRGRLSVRKNPATAARPCPARPELRVKSPAARYPIQFQKSSCQKSTSSFT